MLSNSHPPTAPQTNDDADPDDYDTESDYEFRSVSDLRQDDMIVSSTDDDSDDEVDGAINQMGLLSGEWWTSFQAVMVLTIANDLFQTGGIPTKPLHYDNLAKRYMQDMREILKKEAKTPNFRQGGRRMLSRVDSFSMMNFFTTMRTAMHSFKTQTFANRVAFAELYFAPKFEFEYHVLKWTIPSQIPPRVTDGDHAPRDINKTGYEQYWAAFRDGSPLFRDDIKKCIAKILYDYEGYINARKRHEMDMHLMTYIECREEVSWLFNRLKNNKITKEQHKVELQEVLENNIVRYMFEYEPMEGDFRNEFALFKAFTQAIDHPWRYIAFKKWRVLVKKYNTNRLHPLKAINGLPSSERSVNMSLY